MIYQLAAHSTNTLTIQPYLSLSNQNNETPTFLQTYLLTWADHNGMEINTSKTKETVLGRLASTHLPLLTNHWKGYFIQIAWCTYWPVPFLLHPYWLYHQKATTRLHFLKQLKRTGLSNSHLLHFYITVIRLVLEYCAPVWHFALTIKHSLRA